MSDPQTDQELHPLANIDQVIHAPARSMVLTYLYVVESADYVFLMRLTVLTWGNLSTHMNKLEEAGYIKIHKEFKGKKPHSTISLTKEGRAAFREYKKSLQQVLDDLPDRFEEKALLHDLLLPVLDGEYIRLFLLLRNTFLEQKIYSIFLFTMKKEISQELRFAEQADLISSPA